MRHRPRIADDQLVDILPQIPSQPAGHVALFDGQKLRAANGPQHLRQRRDGRGDAEVADDAFAASDRQFCYSTIHIRTDITRSHWASFRCRGVRHGQSACRQTTESSSVLKYRRPRVAARASQVGGGGIEGEAGEGGAVGGADGEEEGASAAGEGGRGASGYRYPLARPRCERSHASVLSSASSSAPSSAAKARLRSAVSGAAGSPSSSMQRAVHIRTKALRSPSFSRPIATSFLVAGKNEPTDTMEGHG